MTTDGNSRRANANPGTSVSGRLLREWCVNASSDERDWFSVGDRMRATQSFAAQVEVTGAEGSKRIRVPSALILLDGPRGAGKSAIADYFASQFKYGGAEVYHSGCFGYGRVLEEREWYTAINNVKKGSVVFIDETHSVNRQGRDQADIQGIMNEQFAALRKQECLVFCASAMASRIGRVLREMADEIWRPQKMRVELSDRERRRRRRHRVKAKDDPGELRLLRIPGHRATLPGRQHLRRGAGRRQGWSLSVAHPPEAFGSPLDADGDATPGHVPPSAHRGSPGG